MEMYCKDHCKHCGKPNMVYLGDGEDITKLDPDGFVCWSCGGENIFPCVYDIYCEEEIKDMEENDGFNLEDGSQC